MGLKLSISLLISLESSRIASHPPDDWKRQTLIYHSITYFITSTIWVFRGKYKPQTRDYDSPQMCRNTPNERCACTSRQA